MQLLICPGYHSPDLTHDFLQLLLKRITPAHLWILPIFRLLGGWQWLLTEKDAPDRNQCLNVIAFSAGVVAAYPLIMDWQNNGGISRFIAIDGWGMPLPGALSVYRVSHDRWTHNTTFFPAPHECRGYFYASPGVEHLSLWQAPHQAHGKGAIGSVSTCPMTAFEFICDALMDRKAR
ncbi:MAG: hypothetical protein F6K11_02300 [Leptolyngbya sp. SIO3F4]|nr:hypothetical protein [Leptolyngbya sp. SIO3F4]